jgi:hypothetical protein
METVTYILRIKADSNVVSTIVGSMPFVTYQLRVKAVIWSAWWWSADGDYHRPTEG